MQQLLVEKLKDRFLKNPQVTVTIKDRNSQKISVLGQVARPGQVAYYPNMTIVDAIASAGGFTGIAAKNSVNLRREVARQDRDARVSGGRHQRGALARTSRFCRATCSSSTNASSEGDPWRVP